MLLRLHFQCFEQHGIEIIACLYYRRVHRVVLAWTMERGFWICYLNFLIRVWNSRIYTFQVVSQLVRHLPFTENGEGLVRAFIRIKKKSCECHIPSFSEHNPLF